MIGPALLAACALNSFGGYVIRSADVSHPHPALERVAYQVEVDHERLNRFEITHVSKRNGRNKGSLLLLSPFLLPGAFYEISETGQYAKSAAGELANEGYDVWLVDQRRTRLAPGSCEAGRTALRWRLGTSRRTAMTRCSRCLCSSLKIRAPSRWSAASLREPTARWQR